VKWCEQHVIAALPSSDDWIWAAPNLYGCPPGFAETSWGCACRKSLGETRSVNRSAVWVGAIGLGLAATIMIAMGFHKPAPRVRRRRT